MPLRLQRLELSVWPFAVMYAAEILGAFLIMKENPEGRTGALILGQATLGSTVGLLVSVVAILVARRLIATSRSRWWRSVTASLVIYALTAIVSGAAMVVLLVQFRQGSSDFPPLLLVLFTVTRPVNILVLAVVVQQIREGRRTSRQVQVILDDRLRLARRTNSMLEKAERDLRVDSRRLLEQEVAQPLRRIVRDGAALWDGELADRLDDYMTTHLRPMAHVLHPVSVRLGLIPAMRVLNADLIVDATPTVERMDADGVLLDDGVRLQVYRWIRENLSTSEPPRTAVVMRDRHLEVSIFPALGHPIDAVQVAAGIHVKRPGVITAPLLGQWIDVDDDEVQPTSVEQRAQRYRLRDLLTVPLPERVLVVILLGLGAAPLQFVLYQWPLSVAAVVSSLSLAVAAVIVALLIGLLPPPRRTIAGALRVVAQWMAIAAGAAIGLVLPAVAFGLFPLDAIGVLPLGDSESALPLFRMLYRYTIPGLAVVLSSGLVVMARERLDAANEALSLEQRRRDAILAESRQLDRDVAEALHRTVQGRLAAAVVMLRLGQRDEAWSQIVDMAVIEVPGLLERMGVSGVPALDIDIPPGLTVVQVGTSALDTETLGDVNSVLGEIAANARRHGGATTLIVRVERTPQGHRITCDDDGRGLSGGSPGLGSRLLDETVARYGGSWSLEPLDNGCRVTIDLPRDVSDRGFAASAR